jgi:dTDP-4-dehydrorhamnose 3,5-epimerase
MGKETVRPKRVDGRAPGTTMIFPRIEQGNERREDDRGYLEVLYESGQAVLKRSFTRKHAFRGMHWQDESAPQVKIFRIVYGEIVDFIVPMDDPARPIHHQHIRPEDGWVRVDANYAHGLFALEDSLFEYFCDGRYAPEAEQAFSITDHIKAVLGVDEVILSPRDAAAPPLQRQGEPAQ